MPAWKIAAYGAAFVTLFCLMIAIVYANFQLAYFSLLCVFIYIIGYALLFFRATSYEKGKVMFVLLVVLSYLYFTLNLGNTLGVLMELPMIFIVMGVMHWEFFLAEMINGIAFPIFQVMIIVSAFVIYWQIADSLSKAADAAQFAERLRNLDNQLLLQAEFLKETTAHEGEIKQIRHDMRHHFAMLESMISKNDNERARTYLREYIEKVEDSVTPPACKNAVADAVCRRYIAQAENQAVLLTLKRGGGREEGFGLASIRTIVGRYRGLDEVVYDTDRFHIKVLLYFSPPA